MAAKGNRKEAGSVMRNECHLSLAEVESRTGSSACHQADLARMVYPSRYPGPDILLGFQ